MRSSSYVDGAEIVVTGVVADNPENSYNSTYKSYTLYLEAPEAPEGERAWEFQIYSGKLDSKYNQPVAGDTVTVVGRSKIYTPSDATKAIAYEVAYANSHGVSPQITHVFHGSEYYLKGSMNGWAIAALYQLNERVATGAELVTTLANGDEFKIADELWSKEAAWADLTMDASAEGCFEESSGNIKCVKSGTYRFVLDLTDPANEKVTVYAA